MAMACLQLFLKMLFVSGGFILRWLWVIHCGSFSFNTAVGLIMCQGFKTIVIYQIGKQKLDVTLLARFCRDWDLDWRLFLFVTRKKYTSDFVTLSKIKKNGNGIGVEVAFAHGIIILK